MTSSAARREKGGDMYPEQQLDSNFLEAVERGDIDNVIELLEQGADVYAKDDAAFHKAIFLGDKNMITLLAKWRAGPEASEAVVQNSIDIAFTAAAMIERDTERSSRIAESVLKQKRPDTSWLERETEEELGRTPGQGR